MSDDSQLVIPASFVQLFVEPGRVRPSAPRAVIAERYEFCEDLASLLVDQAQLKLWQLRGVSEEDVLQRIHQGLCSDAQLSADEALWISTRLAELLGWAAAPPAARSADPA